MRPPFLLQHLIEKYCSNSEHWSNKLQTHEIFMIAREIHFRGSFVFRMNSVLPAMCQENTLCFSDSSELNNVAQIYLVLIPVSCKCYFIWKKNLCRFD